MSACKFCNAPLAHDGAGCQTEDGARNCDHYVFSEHRPFPTSVKTAPGQLDAVRADLKREHILPFTHGRIKELLREYASTSTTSGHIAGEIISAHAPYIAELLINDLLKRHAPSPKASPQPQVRDAGPPVPPNGRATPTPEHDASMTDAPMQDKKEGCAELAPLPVTTICNACGFAVSVVCAAEREDCPIHQN